MHTFVGRTGSIFWEGSKLGFQANIVVCASPSFFSLFLSRFLSRILSRILSRVLVYPITASSSTPL